MFFDDPLTVLDKHLHRHIPPTLDRVLIDSEAYHWRTLTAREYLIKAAPDLLPCTPANSNVITLHLTDTLELTCVQGKHHYTTTSRPGNMCIFPQETPLSCSWTRPACIMHLYLPHQMIVHTADSMQPTYPGDVELLFRFDTSDLLIYQIGQALLAELKSGGLGGLLYAETLGQALTMHLVRHHSSLDVTRDPPKHQFSSGELARALDYINEHLAQNITLADLATVVNLSPSHFARVFKRSLGLAPHQYLIQQRVEHGRALLLNTNLTVAEVALRVGFADHSHFTRHFKRIHGYPPSVICQCKKLSW